MPKFLITIGSDRASPRVSLEVHAENAQRAGEQADDLRESLEERVQVTPVYSEEELQRADLAYLLNQEARERRRISEAAQWERAINERRGFL